MKRFFKKFNNSILFLMKCFLYLSLMAIFILIMRIENPPIAILSRTMGITLSTYVVSGMLFLRIYGGYDIGRRKSKPIIYSIALAVLLTDLVTYLQIMIMNTIEPDWQSIQFRSIHLLVLTMLIQILCIVVYTYLGNAFYFFVYEPEKSCVIADGQENAAGLIKGIRKFKKQYQVTSIVHYEAKQLYQRIDEAKTVFLAGVPMNERSRIVSYCYEHGKNIYFSPEISDIVETSAEYYMLDDVSLINYRAEGLSMEQRILKRGMDILLSLLLGVVTSPIWLISALAIKIEDGGSVFFKQKRATLNGKEFMVYKFRTMKEHVENYSSTQDDDRITRPGKILRKTRMDELPQILNILRGR